MDEPTDRQADSSIPPKTFVLQGCNYSCISWVSPVLVKDSDTGTLQHVETKALTEGDFIHPPVL